MGVFLEVGPQFKAFFRRHLTVNGLTDFHDPGPVRFVLLAEALYDLSGGARVLALLLVLLLHLILKVGESLLEALTLHFGRKLRPNFTLELIYLLIGISFEDKFGLILVSLSDLLLNSRNLSLRSEGLAQSGEVLELGDRRVVLESLLDDVEVLLHGGVTGGHFDDLNVVGEGREGVERLVYSLDKLWGEAGLHVFKLALELVDSGQGLVNHFDLLARDLGALLMLGSMVLHRRLQDG